MSKTGGQLIAEILDRNQVKNVFCVPGESYLGALDALFDKKKNCMKSAKPLTCIELREFLFLCSKFLVQN